jgi:hypothetical protein
MMKDQWFTFTSAFGEGMNKGLKTAVDAVTNGLPQFVEAFRSYGERMGEIIDDAVRGNYEKLVAAGKLIGDVMGAAAVTAFESFSAEMYLNSKNAITQRKNWFTGEVNPDDLADQKKEREQMDFALGLRQKARLFILSRQAQEVASGTQGLVSGTGGQWRHAKPGESSVFSDSNGNAVIQVLQQIRTNTEGGGKF